MKYIFWKLIWYNRFVIIDLLIKMTNRINKIMYSLSPAKHDKNNFLYKVHKF